MTIRAANNLCKRGTYSSFLQVKRIACFLLLLCSTPVFREVLAICYFDTLIAEITYTI